ncbi:hypothetical protein [Magnetospirillum sp. LM-5]|uniref:hypothetical protein n=1 Tax=Magnetospirillum sp. LM-5 TaxID=2681466 RepID=UPI00156F846F|nr:hypothetical protein [Magnetospirillum sp. LM-5]
MGSTDGQNWLSSYMTTAALESLKKSLREIGTLYRSRLDRARRLFIEERACALKGLRDVEYSVKQDVAQFFRISYASVCFTGSAQLGFSILKNKMFQPGISDLDVACVSADLFQDSWTDVITSTRAFTDETKFSGLSRDEIDLFKQSILRRGMIRVSLMPRSEISREWQGFEQKLTRKYAPYFGEISIAVYMNEYAFCWKQDAALAGFFK